VRTYLRVFPFFRIISLFARVRLSLVLFVVSPFFNVYLIRSPFPAYIHTRATFVYVHRRQTVSSRRMSFIAIAWGGGGYVRTKKNLFAVRVRSLAGIPNREYCKYNPNGVRKTSLYPYGRVIFYIVCIPPSDAGGFYRKCRICRATYGDVYIAITCNF